MKKLSATLLATTLAVFWGSINAQVTVSSFEKTLETPQTDASTDQKLDTADLTRKLEAAGWHVLEEENGNLIVTRKAGDKNDAASGAKQWQDIEQQLQETGWTTRRDADGSLILIPPAIPAPEAPAAKTGQTGSFEDMQQKLRDAGWEVTNTADGSILLYPPASKVTNKPRACPGLPQTAGVSLPVDSWQKAHSIATDWLNHQSGYNATVGKIRKILNVYIVSIVADRTPHTLIQQIAIRNSDGAVIVLN